MNEVELQNFQTYVYNPHSIGEVVASATCEYSVFKGEVKIVTCYGEWWVLPKCIYKVRCEGTITRRKVRNVRHGHYYDGITMDLDNKICTKEEKEKILNEQELKEFMIEGIHTCIKWRCRGTKKPD